MKTYQLFIIASVAFLLPACQGQGSSPRTPLSRPETDQRTANPGIDVPRERKAASSIRGKVTDMNGSSIAKAAVTISGGAYHMPITTLTDASGRYSFSNVPTGNWYLISAHIAGRKFHLPTQVVTLDSDVENIDFTVDQVK